MLESHLPSTCTCTAGIGIGEGRLRVRVVLPTQGTGVKMQSFNKVAWSPKRGTGQTTGIFKCCVFSGAGWFWGM